MASTVAVKTTLLSDMRRFRFPVDGCYKDLLVLLNSLYGSPSVGNTFSVTYVDDEGDHISVTNNLELHEALTYESPTCIRFDIQIKAEVLAPKTNLFESWVVLFSQAKDTLLQNENTKTKKEELDEVIEHFHKVEEKIELSKLLVRATPTGDHKPVTINDLVQNLSKEIAEKMVDLSSRISCLVEGINIPESEVPVLKGALESASKLAAESLLVCNALSDQALRQVVEESAAILASVSSDSNSIMDIMNKIYNAKEQESTLDTLRQSTLVECSALSTATTQQCMNDADDIAALIRDI